MTILRQTGVAVRFLIIATVVLGVLYPAVVFGFSRVVAHQADGGFVADASGNVVGAQNIGQVFDGPQWFRSRPSAAGDGYDAMASAGSNLAADNPDLVKDVAKRKAAAAKLDGVPADSVPADAVTASGSGLDPHISPAYAAEQVARIARVRHLAPEVVQALVDQNTGGRFLGIFGEPRVNVLMLNLALSQQR
jgi:potassium-transporting ATPase KdpC subunit